MRTDYLILVLSIQKPFYNYKPLKLKGLEL
jgi:hypothetical protein